jgi:ATP-binding cassette, subfamily C (CFTR/MRP), member 1
VPTLRRYLCTRPGDPFFALLSPPPPLPALQFIRRCHKVAIVDEGEIKYFGPFTPEAQSILSRYLPVPNEAIHQTVEDTRPKAEPKAAAVISKPESKPVTALRMGPAFKRYIQEGDAWKVIAAICLGLFAISNRQMSDFWVRFWSSDKYKFYKGPDDHGNRASYIYAMTYGAFGTMFLIVQLFRSSIFYWWAAAASNRLYRKILHRVLNTPMGFFLVKPVGELLNTFTSDQDKADENLPDVLHLAGIYMILLLATSVTVSINILEFLAFAAVLVIVTVVMLNLYLPAATQVKQIRLDSAGSLVGLTAETLEGLPLIQAFGHEEAFVHVRRPSLSHDPLYTTPRPLCQHATCFLNLPLHCSAHV